MDYILSHAIFLFILSNQHWVHAPHICDNFYSWSVLVWLASRKASRSEGGHPVVHPCTGILEPVSWVLFNCVMVLALYYLCYDTWYILSVLHYLYYITSNILFILYYLYYDIWMRIFSYLICVIIFVSYYLYYIICNILLIIYYLYCDIWIRLLNYLICDISFIIYYIRLYYIICIVIFE